MRTTVTTMVLMRSLASALAPQRRAARAVSTLGGSSSYSSGDGRRAAPRGAVWLGAAALGGAAYEAQESACAGGRVRVVTYNVLSSSLCEPGYFVKCAAEDLSPPNRLKRVAALLDAEVAKGAVVCLQEVSRDWSGELHAYFAEKGYQFSTGLYGTRFNGYMGVAVAWPSGKYDVLGIDACRIADTIAEPPRERRAKEAKPNFVVRAWRSLKRRAGHVATAATEPLPRGRPPFDTWNEAKRKHNVLVTATLREKGGDAFCVSTYHMPCLFGSVEKEQVMVIHSVLAAERAKRVAAGRPYVLCGDFNVKPYDASYKLLTSGALGEAFAAYAPPPQADVAPAQAFAPVLEPPLTSAYAAATGAEPDFTNFAYTKPMGGERDAFVETLDYIFCSAGQWKVAGVKELRSKQGLDTSKPYPTADEPSDHVMLAADLELV